MKFFTAKKSPVAMAIYGVGIIGALTTSFHSQAAVAKQTKPKLVLQITVDQLRGDMPDAYKSRMGKE